MEVLGTDLLDHAIVSAGLDPAELVCQAAAPVVKKGKGKVGAAATPPGGFTVPSQTVLTVLANELQQLPETLREIGLSSSPTAYIIVKRRDGRELPPGPVIVAEGADALDGFDDDDVGDDDDIEATEVAGEG